MRRLIKPARLGSTAIETLKINPKSRDDIENVLRGLQHLYVNRQRDLQRIFDEEFFADVDWHNGRPGTACRSILVIGVLKQGTDCDFDRLQSLADNHALIRAMLGHDDVFDCGGYEMQTLVDDVSLLTPRMLARVGKLLAASGHEVAGKKPGAALRGRVDSFCVETDVHFPTDVNLLMDAVRRMVRETARRSRLAAERASAGRAAAAVSRRPRAAAADRDARQGVSHMNQSKDNSIRSYPQGLLGARLWKTFISPLIRSRAILSRVPLAGGCRQGEAGAKAPARPGWADSFLVHGTVPQHGRPGLPVPAS